MPGFDRTQHLIGHIVVDRQDEREADCRIAVRGDHVFVEGDERAVWMMAGHYRATLNRDGWKVAAHPGSLYEEGDRQLTERAAARVEAGHPGLPGREREKQGGCTPQTASSVGPGLINWASSASPPAR